MNITHIAIGTVMLFLGRKLFWLFVGCIGFAAAYTYTERIIGQQPDHVIVIISVLAGVLGAVCAHFIQRLAIGIAGFMAGSYITMNLLTILGFSTSQFAWIFGICGGFIGVLLLAFVFDWALIILSSLTGTSMILESVRPEPQVEMIGFGVLMIFGVAVQAKLMTVGPEGEERKRKGR